MLTNKISKVVKKFRKSNNYMVVTAEIEIIMRTEGRILINLPSKQTGRLSTKNVKVMANYQAVTFQKLR